MQVKLRIVGGKHAGKEIEIRRESFVIGRGEGCDLRPASETVSRRHCVLVTDANGVLVRDLGSSNGTRVNDVRIQGEHPLSPGDHLKVGTLHFEVLISEPKQDLSPHEVDAKETVEYVPAKTKSKPEDYIQDWLTDSAPSANQLATVDLKLDETSAEPRVPLAAHADPSSIQPHQEERSTIRRKATFTKLMGVGPGDSLEVKDASDAAGVLIGDFLSAVEKNRQRR